MCRMCSLYESVWLEGQVYKVSKSLYLLKFNDSPMHRPKALKKWEGN